MPFRYNREKFFFALVVFQTQEIIGYPEKIRTKNCACIQYSSTCPLALIE